MHEMSLMASIFDIIGRNLEAYPGARVKKVKLVVGAMTNVVPDAMQMAFEAMGRGTPAEGAELTIEEVPLTARCHECKWQGEIEEYRFFCPACSSPQLELLTGRELYIESLEVE